LAEELVAHTTDYLQQLVDLEVVAVTTRVALQEQAVKVLLGLAVVLVCLQHIDQAVAAVQVVLAFPPLVVEAEA
tara:strand:- start:79 stop:300 length:222 start_codon:yes stop_codon:yes gene_type:complete